MEVERKDRQLKYLGFMRMAAVQALVCVSDLYDYAKQNSGPLRSTVGTVEGAVATVVGPVCEKFKGVPDHLLVFLDEKVDDVSHKFDERAPPAAKHAVGHAQSLIQKAAQKFQKLISEARNNGARGALHYAASEYKQLVLTSSVIVWVKLNHHHSFHSMADMALPTAACWSDKYNHIVKDMSHKGYPVFGYLPLVPVDEIKKAVKQAEARDGANGKADEHKSDSDSDSG